MNDSVSTPLVKKEDSLGLDDEATVLRRPSMNSTFPQISPPAMMALSSQHATHELDFPNIQPKRESPDNEDGEQVKQEEPLPPLMDEIESGDEDSSRVSAYARLDFESFTFYVQTLQVVLGRRVENSSSMVDVHLGDTKAISRKHAKIFYNFGTQRFELSVLGRNGAFVDDVFVETGSTVPLKDGTKVQVGTIPFSFVLPSLPDHTAGSPTPINPADALSMRSNNMKVLSRQGSPAIVSPRKKSTGSSNSKQSTKSATGSPGTPILDPLDYNLPAEVTEAGASSSSVNLFEQENSKYTENMDVKYDSDKYSDKYDLPLDDMDLDDAVDASLSDLQPVYPTGSQYNNMPSQQQHQNHNQQSNMQPGNMFQQQKPQSKPRKQPKREYQLHEIPEEYRTKPNFSFSHLIATALEQAPDKGVSLAEIYRSIQEIFPYYKYCPHGWQNSVRHNLSSSKTFRKVSKEGKGWLWGIDREWCAERDRQKRKSTLSKNKSMRPDSHIPGSAPNPAFSNFSVNNFDSGEVKMYSPDTNTYGTQIDLNSHNTGSHGGQTMTFDQNKNDGGVNIIDFNSANFTLDNNASASSSSGGSSAQPRGGQEIKFMPGTGPNGVIDFSSQPKARQKTIAEMAQEIQLQNSGSQQRMYQSPYQSQNTPAGNIGQQNTTQQARSQAGSSGGKAAAPKLGKDAMKILALLQQKISQQFQQQLGGKAPSSALITNALAIAIAQATKKNPSGGVNALQSLLNGDNAQQLNQIVMAAYNAVKSKQDAQGGSRQPTPQQSTPQQSTLQIKQERPMQTQQQGQSQFSAQTQFSSQSPAPQYSPPAQASPQVSQSPQIVASGTPASGSMPGSATASPAPVQAQAPVQQPPAQQTPAPQAQAPAPASSAAPTPSASSAPAAAPAGSSSSPPAAKPAGGLTSLSNSDTTIAQVLEQASKISNPSPAVQAALKQLRAHAEKYGADIPIGSLGKLPKPGDNKRKAEDAPPSQEQPAKKPLNN
ncbi:Fork-head transcriptional regulator FHL1 [Yarrowia sp. B02]|nr:Fork-head transcriptional regulator FHL1 [Yarrowia sp. B02]